MLVTIRPAPGGIGGVIAAPPSKSMAHRAVLCAALAALTFAGMALLRWPLAWVLPALGGVACVLTWRKIAP